MELPKQLWDPRQIFERHGPVTLEIGFGHGETLLHEAQTCPSHNVLGIEVHQPALMNALKGADRLGLGNLRLMNGDATELLPHLVEGSLHQIRILFPDPWPKWRHRKRRLIQAPFLAQCARCVEAGGRLHLATDWPTYADQIEDLLKQSVDWGSEPILPDRPSTHFERRGRTLWHPIREWVMHRVSLG